MASLSFAERAACRGIDAHLFFPDRHNSASVTNRAKAVCAVCPVIDECREWGIRHEKMGIWGGTSGRERIEIRRRRGIAVEDPRWTLMVDEAVFG